MTLIRLNQVFSFVSFLPICRLTLSRFILCWGIKFPPPLQLLAYFLKNMCLPFCVRIMIKSNYVSMSCNNFINKQVVATFIVFMAFCICNLSNNVKHLTNINNNGVLKKNVKSIEMIL